MTHVSWRELELSPPAIATGDREELDRREEVRLGDGAGQIPQYMCKWDSCGKVHNTT